MKILIQRVKSASVTIEEKLVSKIGKGLLIFLGIASNDSIDQIEYLAKKCVNLRIFPARQGLAGGPARRDLPARQAFAGGKGKNGKMNLCVKDIEGEILLVSQFTLCANCKKGNRPSFTDSAKPEVAEKLYKEFAKELTKNGIKPKLGIFGALMEVELVNLGPATFMLEK